jgi:hypothetical protein
VDCGCRGLLLQFTAKIIRWGGLRAERPNVLTLEERCQVCGRAWRLTFRAEPNSRAVPHGFD